jgi:signal transduction histidine kinase
VPDDVNEQLLGALREALSNVARHVGASKVDVSLHVTDEVSLVVANDGPGSRKWAAAVDSGAWRNALPDLAGPCSWSPLRAEAPR